jgi:hypothetical protein
MKDILILGTGTAAIVAAFFLCNRFENGNERIEITLIGDDIYGNLLAKDDNSNNVNYLGPRIIQVDRLTKLLLFQLYGNELSILENKIGYIYDWDENRSIADECDEAFKKNYSIMSRNHTSIYDSSYVLSGSKSSILYYNKKYNEFLNDIICYLNDKRHVRFEFIYETITDIYYNQKKMLFKDKLHNSYVYDFSNFDCVINTIPINIFSKLIGENEDTSDRTKLVYFSLCDFIPTSKFYEEFIKYSYIYSADKIEADILRITPNSVHRTAIVESAKELQNDVIYFDSLKLNKQIGIIPKLSLLTQDKVKKTSYILDSSYCYDRYKDIIMLGRFAQADPRIKLEQLLERLETLF